MAAEEDLGIRLRANGVVETTNGIDLTGDAVERLGRRADVASKRLPDLGKASRDAAGGATALGGALREAANEATALLPVPAVARSALLGLTGSLGIAATAALALGAAYVQGHREDAAFRQSIVLTGNAAGVTTGMLRDMARGVAAMAGTQSEAAVALSQLVGGGQVAANELQRATEAAVRLHAVAGVALDETVRQFAALGKDPVKASVALNERTNFLTRSLYEQIRALEKQGLQSHAAALAQSAYADAMIGRAKELEGRLGFLERAWNSVKGAAKGAWDAMLDVGREQSIAEKIASVDAALKALDTRRSQNPQLTAQRRAVLAEQREALLETERLAKRAATARAEEAAATRDYIAQREGERDKKGRKAADPGARLEDAVQRQLALAQAELQAGEQLTQADRFRIQLLLQIDEIQGRIGAKRAGELRAAVETTTQQLRAVEAQREQAKAQAELDRQFQAARDAAAKAAYAEREQIEAGNRALAESTAEVGLNAEALTARKLAQIDDTIATKEARLARIEGLPAYAEEAAALRQTIDLLRERKGLQLGKYAADVRQKEIDENKKRQDDLTDSITNGMLEGFRNGQSIAEAFRRELVGQFAATVLRPSVSFLVGQVYSGGGGGWLGSVLGGIGSLFGLGGGGWTGEHHGGGVVGVDPPRRMRYVPRALFAAAPRLHGGLAADEYPAILQRGESVLTPGQMRAMRGGAGRQIVYSPTIHIDSRTDRAEVAALVGQAVRQSQAELVEMMDRGQV